MISGRLLSKDDSHIFIDESSKTNALLLEFDFMFE